MEGPACWCEDGHWPWGFGPVALWWPGFWLEAQEAEGCSQVQGAVPEGCGDVPGPGKAEKANGKVPQPGHCLGGRPLTDTAVIFIKGHVAHPVDAVFDRPVAPVQFQKLPGGCLALGEACDANRNVAILFPTVQASHDTFHPEDLMGVGEVDVVFQLFTRPDPTCLQAAVPLVGGFLLRGEKPPAGGPRCPLEGLVGWL